MWETCLPEESDPELLDWPSPLFLLFGWDFKIGVQLHLVFLRDIVLPLAETFAFPYDFGWCFQSSSFRVTDTFGRCVHSSLYFIRVSIMHFCCSFAIIVYFSRSFLTSKCCSSNNSILLLSIWNFIPWLRELSWTSSNSFCSSSIPSCRWSLLSSIVTTASVMFSVLPCCPLPFCTLPRSILWLSQFSHKHSPWIRLSPEQALHALLF